MITYETIDGRKATIAYINDELEPVDRDEATMIKIIFDDGEIRFGVKAPQDRLKSQFASEKRRAMALLGKHGDHDQSTHGNWSDGPTDDDKDSGDKKPSAVPGYKAGIKARSDGFSKVRAKWVNESPIKTIEDVQRTAPIAQANFAEAGNKIAGNLGVTFKNPTAKTQKIDEKTGEVVENPKGVARILEKLAEKEKEAGGPVSIARITDTARGTFVLNHPDDAEKVMNELAKTHEIIDEGWRTIPDSHYTDRPLLFRDRETGLIGELQLTHPDLLDAKDNRGGHKLYEDSRSLPKGHPDIPSYNAKMQALYGEILDNLDDDWKVIDGRWKRS